MRIEKDFLGEVQVADDALYGVHTARALENFPGTQRFHHRWYRAIGLVKLACFQAYRDFSDEVKKEYPKFDLIEDKNIDALMEMAEEISQGKHFDHFRIPAISGGAGTSINMNINEILANGALKKIGKNIGEYQTIDPIESANVYQSTNDVIPTSLKVAMVDAIVDLEETVKKTRHALEQLEKKYRHVPRMGATQMQRALPSTYGLLFGGYQEAISRDWWRISKCFERLKVVNIGGGAIGTAQSIPRFFVFSVIEKLRQVTGRPFARGENIHDATANLDSLVEVMAIIKTHAVNLHKMSNDIRLLSATLLEHPEVKIPARQVGSSIMPGKVNPVIVEYVTSISTKVMSSENTIANLASSGTLDLNAYLPLIGDLILDSIEQLINANESLTKNLLVGLTVDESLSKESLIKTSSITTVLIPLLGYNKASELAHYMEDNQCDLLAANKKLKLIEQQKLEELLKSEHLTQLGFSLKEGEKLWR